MGLATKTTITRKARTKTRTRNDHKENGDYDHDDHENSDDYDNMHDDNNNGTRGLLARLHWLGFKFVAAFYYAMSA